MPGMPHMTAAMIYEYLRSIIFIYFRLIYSYLLLTKIHIKIIIFVAVKQFYKILMKQIFRLLGLCVCAAACNNPSQNLSESDFIDSVTKALANNAHIDLDDLVWTREPASYTSKGDTIAITTAPYTELWQRTYYHFRNDNAPVLQMKTREQYFSFVVKTDFTHSHHRFDQCWLESSFSTNL